MTGLIESNTYDYMLGMFVMSFAIFNLRKNYSSEIYTIWYAFSLSITIFFALYYQAVMLNTSITSIFGREYSTLAESIFHALTDAEGELKLVILVLYLSIVPQLLAYTLSGVSGSANSPVLISQVRYIAIWSLIKFVACLSGITFARVLKDLVFSHAASHSDLKQGVLSLSAAFLMADMQHRLLEGSLNYSFPDMFMKIYSPALLFVNRFFKRNSHKVKYPPSVKKILYDEARTIRIVFKSLWIKSIVRVKLPLRVATWLKGHL